MLDYLGYGKLAWHDDPHTLTPCVQSNSNDIRLITDMSEQECEVRCSEFPQERTLLFLYAYSIS